MRVVVGMSVTDVDRRQDLLAWADELDASLAFLQMGGPSLSAELTRIADTGAETITLVGVSLGPLAPGHSWLRRIAAHWWRERSGDRPEIQVAPRLATTRDELVEALTETRPVTGTEPGLTSPAWERVPGHVRQVLICRGPRCTAKGSEETARAVILGAMEAGLGDDDLLITHTGCQFPCNQAPVLSVQPDDVWYGNVEAAAARAIVRDHLDGGRPVEAYRLPR
ncbi:(2Fe-2S) ferredoxin domain-containing protein [Nocardioides sp. KC13]|uniref:(2Fe-2S) ferredoxin domain-containing protein n=1 Tax=Nocardioides turkmenicus TaxID=2711220 RepID=A0A6M1QZQ6_9ACTN|nr:(2Fe-2S) ferredoxin domain-containing protein [Nocardioides sp. KC13]NGN91941.1 (2Fe-2S) ferredoxin domain-containing protein [Nocardioides sp. KC13]